MNKHGKRFSLEQDISERKAFQRVMMFRRKTGIDINNINQIKSIKRKQNGRWDR